MIFFDFDGTIVDVWTRYYKVFCGLTNAADLNREEYVQIKQKMFRDDSVAAHFGINLPDKYYERKRELLEAPEYLNHDTLLVSQASLIEFLKFHPFRILTIRRNSQNFFDQLDHLGLTALKNICIVLNPEKDDGKLNYLRENYFSGQHVLIGDSDADKETVALKNVQVILVRTGLRDPDDIDPTLQCGRVDNITDIISHC